MTIRVEDVYRQVMALERRVDGLIKPEISPTSPIGQILGEIRGLPGLRGAWVMSAVNTSGDAADLSDLGNPALYQGNPAYTVDGRAPCLVLDGTGDWLYLADAAHWDITGAETIIAAAIQGLTVLGWFQATVPANTQGLITKWTGAGVDRSWELQLVAGAVDFSIVDGVPAVQTVAVGTPTADTWFFAAGRIDRTGQTIDVWCDNETNSAAIPAATTIQSGAADVGLGGFHGGATLLTGRLSVAAICAAAVDDDRIARLYRLGRQVF